MNWVLLCEKNNRKQLESQIKLPENLLGTITDVDEDVYTKVFENYNPHGVIISGFECEIPLKFKELRHSLKVVYLTEITLGNTETIEKLLQSDITVTDKLCFENLPLCSDTRFRLTELSKVNLEKIAFENTETRITSINEKSKKLNICLNENTFNKDDFNGKKTLFINEHEFEIPKGKIFIGVSELQHHIGCTHVSFEIAEYLRQQNCGGCVVIYDKTTFRNLAQYYGINSANGFEVNGIKVYDYDMLENAVNEHQYIICDYGFLRKAFKPNYAEKSIKIMLVSGANWDLNVITEYLNTSDDSFKRDINYLFYPVKQADFIRINKQFLRANCKAYRLQTSPECTLPCKENKAVYGRILGLKNKKK